ncbi:efflux RND transporter permease subunit [Candidatus Uabimicrobium sp. HlEnr_7]|uniref:efflux RND transporter permease subunit n=1 Tax=Candidatus Uabimicrobium helgolandensis TaxID=3095367 RepID=UPI003557BBE6
MLNRIIAFSLKNRLFVMAIALLVMAYGTIIAIYMPIDVLPDLNRPLVTILTEAPSMVPEDIERLITLPMEQVLNGSTGVTRVRSGSGLGLSVIYVEFDWGTDIYRNRQIVQEKLQLIASKLPPDITPQMAPISSIMGQIQMIGVQSKSGTIDPTDLRVLADYTIKYRLLAIQGVAQIVTIGGAPRQLQIIVDIDKLRLLDVSLDEIQTAVQKTNINSSGGFLSMGAKSPIITVIGFAVDEEAIEDAVVKISPTRPIRLKDVAEIKFGPALVRTGEAGIDGKGGVIMVIFKQPQTDTVTLTNRINKELQLMQEGFPEDIVLVNDLFQQATFIHRAIDNVIEAVRDGGILVVIVLLLFLMNLRITFITLTAIPLSVAITAIIFSIFDLSINTMTLGGLAVAIGALVDDAIVDVENVHRRLKENAQLKFPKNKLWVIFRASSEVRQPILIGTLLVIVVYLPLFFLSGLEGRLFTPIGIAYILSVSASLFVALTVTPILCYTLLSNKEEHKEKGDSWVVRCLKIIVGKMIFFSIKQTKIIIGLFLSLLIISIFLLMTRGSQFLPPFNEGVAQINMFLPPEVGLETSDLFGGRLEKILTQVEGVKHIARRTGRAEGDEHAEGVNNTEIIITFDSNSKRSRKEIIGEVRQKIKKDFRGIPTEVDQPLSHLLSHMMSGVRAQVAIKIFGTDLDVLRSQAKKVKAAIENIPGIADLYVEQQVLVDNIVIEPKREELARLGLTVEDISEFIELAMEGEIISRMRVESFTFPIILRLEENDRNDLEKIRNFRIKRDSGISVLFSDIANVYVGKTPNNINRENVSRRIVIQHNIAGRSLGEVVADVDKALDPIRKELAQTPGYSIQIGGQYEAQVQATRMIFILSIASILIMFMVLYIYFKSVNLSLQILMSIPMAFVGGVFFIVWSEQPISIATLVGLISLGGIASRNAILLVDRYLYLMREEKIPFGMEMIIRAGQERMVPVMMTALSSGIALVPIALYPDKPGSEILYPVATVIIGGLISSTILDFLVRPAIFWLFGKNAAETVTQIPEEFDAATEKLFSEFQSANGSNS